MRASAFFEKYCHTILSVDLFCLQLPAPFIQQAVQVYRHKIDHANGGQVFCISEPAAAEIDPAFGAGAQVTYTIFLSRPILQQSHILAITFGPCGSAIVPITIQNGAVGHFTMRR